MLSRASATSEIITRYLLLYCHKRLIIKSSAWLQMPVIIDDKFVRVSAYFLLQVSVYVLPRTSSFCSPFTPDLRLQIYIAHSGFCSLLIPGCNFKFSSLRVSAYLYCFVSIVDPWFSNKGLHSAACLRHAAGLLPLRGIKPQERPRKVWQVEVMLTPSCNFMFILLTPGFC
jgi:hypothetical protein